MTLIYFGIEHAKRIHDEIILKSGGFAGIANIGITESTLEHIQNDDYYPTFEEKLTHLFFCLVENHSFLDGTKRSAIALGAYFLEINGYKQYIVSRFIREMENAAVYVADNKIDKSLLRRMISALVQGKDFDEELKLEILKAITK